MLSYDFRNRTTQKSQDEFIKCIHLFVFKSTKSNLTYIIEAEVHKYIPFIAIKFYCKSHKLAQSKKYSYLTNTFEANRIVNTCLKVIPELLYKYPKYSFGAVGSRGISQDEKIEPTAINQRYRVYSTLMFREFSQDVRFSFIESPENAGFILLNIEDFAGLEISEMNDKINIKYYEIADILIKYYNEIHIL